MSILLVYPPFGAPHKPYASVAALAGYLRGQGIATDVLDLNNECLLRALAPDNLDRSLDLLADRLERINDLASLEFPDMVEFSRLVGVAEAVHQAGDAPWRVLDPGAFPDGRQRLAAAQVGLNLAATVHLPDVVDYQGDFVKVLTRRSEYSSRDLAEHAVGRGPGHAAMQAVLAPLLAHRAYDVIGISLCFPDQALWAFACAALARKLAPGAHVTVGGPFVSCQMRRADVSALFAACHSLVLDDGELPLLRLHEEATSGAPDLTRVPGLLYPRDGGLGRNPTVAAPRLATLPPPDYTAYDADRYLLPRGALYLPYRLSRGCAWARCAFCRTELPLIHDYQKADPDAFFEGMRHIIRETGQRRFFFSDDSAPPLVLEALSKRILAEKLPVRWAASQRVDARLTLERCLLFRQAGCMAVNIGVEAYNDRLLQLMRKGITTAMIDRALSNLSWAGIPVGVYLIIGFPTETEAEAVASHAALSRFKQEGLLDNFLYHPYHLLSYSAVARNPAAFGVTAVNAPPGADLDPPVMDIACAGMSREAMVALWKRLSGALESSNSKSAGQRKARAGVAGAAHGVEALFVGRRQISLRYDPAEAAAAVDGLAGLQADHARRLEAGSQRVAPLQPRKRP